MGSVEMAFISLLLTVARVETSLFLGLGVGAIYGLVFCQVAERAALHFTHAMWATEALPSTSTLLAGLMILGLIQMWTGTGCEVL